MGDGMDPRVLALAVAEFFGTDLELEERMFPGFDGELRAARGRVRYPETGGMGEDEADREPRAVFERSGRARRVAAARLVLEDGLGYVEVGRRFSVSDTAVRRWVEELCEAEGLAVPVRARKSPDGTREESLRLYFEEGLSAREVAERLGVSREVVSRWAMLRRREAGPALPALEGRRSRYGLAVRREAERLRARGLSYQQVGERLGVPAQTVWQWFRPPRSGRARPRG